MTYTQRLLRKFGGSRQRQTDRATRRKLKQEQPEVHDLYVAHVQRADEPLFGYDEVCLLLNDQPGQSQRYFIDANQPGIVYLGTESHMLGLRREGGCPCSLLVDGPIDKGRMRVTGSCTGRDGFDGWWDIRPLHREHFWALSDEQYYSN